LKNSRLFDLGVSLLLFVLLRAVCPVLLPK
jgi:hypothetical protein